MMGRAGLANRPPGPQSVERAAREGPLREERPPKRGPLSGGNAMRHRHPDLVRRTLLVGGAATLVAPRLAFGQAANTVRIGVPTKTYFPTIIAETAIRQKLFEKEG